MKTQISMEDGKDVSMTEEKIKTIVYYGVKELDIGTITKED